jgi:hypothetical protein
MFRKRREVPIVDDPQMSKRAASLPSDQLIMWFEIGVAGIGELVDSVLHHDAPDEEVTKSLEALLVMWREVQRRGPADERSRR